MLMPFRAASCQDSRNSGHRDDDITGFSSPMAKPIYRGVFKDVSYNFTKGMDEQSHEMARNTDFVNRSKADREDSNTYHRETST